MKNDKENILEFGASKENSFKVPEDYFEKLPLRIMVNREVKSFKRTYWAWTAAAGSLSLAVALYFFAGQQNENTHYTSEKQTVHEEYIQMEVTEDELIDFYLSAEETIN